MNLIKLAEPGIDDAQFERQFSDLAFAKLKDAAPRLLDFLVGFQVIQKNDDGSKAAGVFGFDVNGQWYYAPVFFINGELKGNELLYIKNQDIFVPLQENWVNYVVSRKPIILGKGTKKRETELGVMQPVFSPYKDSPLQYAKYSSVIDELKKYANADNIGYWWKGRPFDITPVLQAAATSPSVHTKQAEKEMHLPTVLYELGPKVAANLVLAMRKNAKFAGSVLKFYGLNDILLNDFKGFSVTKKANKVIEKVSAAKGLVAIYKDDASQINDLTDTEKHALVTDGVVLRDYREKTASAFSATLNNQLANPTETGVFKLLIRPASTIDALVIHGPMLIGKGSTTADVVIPLEGKDTRPLKGSATSFFVGSTADSNKRYDAKFKDLPSVESVAKDKTYVILTADRRGTMPFTVRKKSTEDGVITLWVSTASYVNDGYNPTPLDSRKRPTIDYAFPSMDVSSDSKDDNGPTRIYSVRRIVIHDKVASLAVVNDTLMVSAKCKVLEVDDDYGNRSVYPGSIDDVETEIMKSADYSVIGVFSSGNKYQVRGEKISSFMDKGDSMYYLASKYGIKAAEAKAIVETAAKNGMDKFIVKLAGELDPGPDSPSVASLSEGMNFFDPRSRAIMQPPIETETIVDQMKPQTDKHIYDPNPWLDQIKAQTPMQVAQQAAQSGQKEIFDVAVLAGLVNQNDIDVPMEKYLGNLVLGEDRIGRILFLFYWHNEKFAERYGQDEMAELEDSLRNTFKGLGDIILFLKKRATDPDLSMTGTDISLSPKE